MHGIWKEMAVAEVFSSYLPGGNKKTMKHSRVVEVVVVVVVVETK
jgi:hypothetical protein